MHAILTRAAALFDVRPHDLTGRCRRRTTVAARQAAMYALRHTTTLSLSEIGLLFGGRDHTTVAWGIAAAQDRAATDPGYRAKLDALLAPAPAPASVARVLRAFTLTAVESGHLYWSYHAFGYFLEPKAA